MKQENNFTPEQEFLLQALRDYANGDKTTVPDGIDVSALVSLGNAQQLDPVLYYQTKLPELEYASAAASFRAVNQKKLLKQLHSLFTENGIPYMVVKGPEVACYHPQPYIRTSADLDILLHACDRLKAAELLENLGFETPSSKECEQEWSYEKGPLEVELHPALLYDDNLNDKRLIAFADTVWAHASAVEGTRFRLEPEYHFVYLLLHIRKHLLYAGIGIRQFLDVAMMMKNAGLDYGKARGYVDECGITRFAGVCFALIERWFGIRCPMNAEGITDERYYSLTRGILSGGTFGNKSRENIFNNGVANAIRKKGKILSTLTFMFPDWAHMKQKYPQRARHKIQLPFLWVRRIVEMLFKRPEKGGINYVDALRNMDRREKERSAGLSEWGL